MKKIGLLCLVLVLALGTLGMGYAKWSQTLTINGTVNTGTLIVGIRDDGTSDPVTSGDDFDQEFDFSQGVSVDLDKDVASTESVNGEFKCWHDDVKFYHDITFTVTDAYPWYYWEEYIEIANCGTTPAKIDSLEVYHAGAWKPIHTVSSYEVWSGDLGECIWMGYWKIEWPGQSAIEGKWIDELLSTLQGLDTQLDPCQTAKVTLGFFVFQGIDPHEHDLDPPQDATSDMYLRVNFCNWNEP